MEAGSGEGACSESEQLFGVILENMVDPVFVTDEDGRFIFICANVLPVLGYTVEEVAATGTLAGFLGRGLWWPGELESRGELTNLQCSIMRKDGAKRDFLVAAKKVSIGRGAVLCVFRDVTERVEAETRVADSEERMRLVLKAARIGLWDWDVKKDLWYASPTYYTMLGYEPRPGLADRGEWLERVHPEDRPGVAREIQKVLQEEFDLYRYEARMRHADGTYRWVSVVGYGVTHDPDGSLARIIGLRQDITDRKRADEALRASEAQLENAMDIAHLVNWEFDVDSGLFTFNDRFYAFYGTTAEAEGGYLMPADVYAKDFVHPDEQHLIGEEVQRALRTTDPDYRAYVEHRIIRRDGAVRHIAVRYGITKDEHGRTVKTHGANQDITELKRAEEALFAAEEQLRQAQKMEAIGQLAGGIAHDFNNLLMAIIGYADLAMAADDLPRPARAHVEEIKKAADRAADLTRQILAFSRRQTLRPQVLCLNDVVQGMEGLLRRTVGEDIDLNLVLDPDLNSAEVDPVCMEQVLMNLVVNARDAMSGGGPVTIETGNVKLEAEFAQVNHWAEPGPYVTLTVSDTGCGMDEATKDRVFEPFFTTKEQGRGTGLGLSTVYGIIKQSGGSITVDSEPDRGSSFKIYLPAVPRQATARELHPVPRETQGGSETILVVEDEEGVRQLISHALTSAGYRVQAGASWREISDQLESQEVVPGLLVTDVVLPDRVDGLEVVERLRRRFPDLPVLFMSGYAQGAMRPGMGPRKDMEFLQKPFELSVLLQRVREILDSSGGA
jgi:two-component system, cell cycle sensor histidine kinase and response regulator CckA